jgi:DNA-binding FadR family transcriptional regulator
MQTRLVIESGALPCIAAAMAEDAGIFHRLDAMVEASRRRDDAQWRVASDVAFHRALLEASAIGPLLVFDDLLQIFFARFFEHPEVLPTDDPWKRVVDEHEKLICLLRAGKVDAARRTLFDHLGHYAPRFGVEVAPRR